MPMIRDFGSLMRCRRSASMARRTAIMRSCFGSPGPKALPVASISSSSSLALRGTRKKKRNSANYRATHTQRDGCSTVNHKARGGNDHTHRTDGHRGAPHTGEAVL